jgi:hypothetical protein
MHVALASAYVHEPCASLAAFMPTLNTTEYALAPPHQTLHESCLAIHCHVVSIDYHLYVHPMVVNLDALASDVPQVMADLAAFKFGSPEVEALCCQEDKQFIMKHKDEERRKSLKMSLKKRMLHDLEVSKLAQVEERTTRSAHAAAMAAKNEEKKAAMNAQMAASTVIDGMADGNAPGIYTTDVEFEASLRELTTDVVRATPRSLRLLAPTISY